MKKCFNCDDSIAKCICGDTEGYETIGALCPWCGHLNLAENSDGLLYDEKVCDYICEECDKEFEVRVYCSYTWTTTKRKGGKE